MQRSAVVRYADFLQWSALAREVSETIETGTMHIQHTDLQDSAVGPGAERVARSATATTAPLTADSPANRLQDKHIRNHHSSIL